MPNIELQYVPSTQDLAELSTSQSELNSVPIDTDFSPEHRKSEILNAIPGTTLDYCIRPELEKPNQTVFIGRSTSAEIKVSVNDVSRMHVAITVERNVTTGKIEYVVINNQEPVNGTALNGRKMENKMEASGPADLMDFSVVGLVPTEGFNSRINYILVRVGNSLQVCQIAYNDKTRAKIARAQSDRKYAQELKLSLLAAAYRDGKR